MSDQLRVLIVEDSVDDTFFIVRELQRGGFLIEFERVETPVAMEAALERQMWDVVISDYSMPLFGGQAALALFQKRELDIPFIVVSGAIGEDLAVDMLKAGADEYVMKDRLNRLVPAVRNELQAAKDRRIRRQMQSKTAYLASLVQSCDDSIIGTTVDGTIVSWNAGSERLFGYGAAEIIGKSIGLLFPLYRPELWSDIMQNLNDGKSVERLETIRLRKDGGAIEVSVSVSPIRDASERIIGVSSIARDISQRRQEENERLALIQELTAALSHSHPVGAAPATSESQRKANKHH